MIKYYGGARELSGYQYDIMYRPGKLNIPSDTLSRVCSAVTSPVSLEKLHDSLCHPGITRLNHFVKSKNLPYSINDVRRVCAQCPICSELKPRFFKPPASNLVHSLRPFDRLSVDFVGPKVSCTQNKYLLVMVDEFSRFPFAFPCHDMTATTVISCFRKLFSVFGCPASIHSDRGTQFMSKEVSTFLMNHGVIMTHSTPYHPQGNGQCERINGIIWKSVCLALRSRNLKDSQWELVLDTALHSIRSLLCTATNQTPHERMFSFPRKSPNGYSLPTWLSSPGPVYLRKFVRTSKSDPLVEPVHLVSATPHCAKVRFPDGRESTVSTGDLSPKGTPPEADLATRDLFPQGTSPAANPSDTSQVHDTKAPESALDVVTHNDSSPSSPKKCGTPIKNVPPAPGTPGEREPVRRSTRVRKPVDRLIL